MSSTTVPGTVSSAVQYGFLGKRRGTFIYGFLGKKEVEVALLYRTEYTVVLHILQYVWANQTPKLAYL